MFKIIKLNAIDSTNDFLKSYVSQELPEHQLLSMQTFSQRVGGTKGLKMSEALKT